MKPTFRVGVEEEFFIVDAESGRALSTMPPAFWAAALRSAPNVSKELLQSQIELQTEPCLSADALRGQLFEGRAALALAAREHGIALMAAGTHPTMDWREAIRSSGPRYSKLVRDMRVLAQRNMFCGLHVHVEAPDPDSRVRLICRCVPFLPLFLALSVSSPFWCGEWTGMCGYRLTGYDELPRTGLPPVFSSEGDLAQYVSALKDAGHIPDASYIWWVIRPSARYPTIELRICDSVTDVGHAAAIAALFRCLVRRLWRDKSYGPEPSPLLRAITDENRWQVQCDGVHAVLVDPFSLQPSSATDLISLLCEDLKEDAAALGCEEHFVLIRSILRAGASAERQIDIMQSAIDRGATFETALSEVSAWLVAETLRH